MKKIQLRFLIVFVFLSSVDLAFSQGLHHQMLASQVTSAITGSGLAVSQSIGQLSMGGTYSKNGLIVQQGFQQSLKYVKTATKVSSNRIITTFFPNPVRDYVNFQFSSPLKGAISISIFDVAGRFIREQVVAGDSHTVVTLEALNNLPEGQFLVLITAAGYKFSTSLIKTK